MRFLLICLLFHFQFLFVISSHGSLYVGDKNLESVKVFLNYPNDLAEQLEIVSEQYTDQLLEYIKFVDLAERRSLSNDREMDGEFFKCVSSNVFYYLYIALSMEYYSGPLLMDFILHLKENLFLKTRDRPLMQGAILLCNKHPGIKIGDMLVIEESTKQDDKDIKAFMTHKANDIRRYYKTPEEEYKNNCSSKEGSDSSWLGKMRKAADYCKNILADLLNTPKKLLSRVKNKQKSSLISCAAFMQMFGLIKGACKDKQGLDVNERYCDGYTDCADGRDELNERCLDQIKIGVLFGCSNGQESRQAILSNRTCDGNRDCIDSSDDTYDLCNIQVKNGTLFRCTNNNTVKFSVLCDGNDDCGDFSDDNSVNCLEKFHRNEVKYCGVHRVIPIGSECNILDDCSRGDDKLHDMCCEEVSEGRRVYCGKGIFLNSSTRCDKVEDCYNGRDESFPSCLTQSSTLIRNADNLALACECNEKYCKTYEPYNVDTKSGYSSEYMWLGLSITAAFGYIVFLGVSSTDLLDGGSVRSWLFSPITKSYCYIRRCCGYIQAPSQDIELGGVN